MKRLIAKSKQRPCEPGMLTLNPPACFFLPYNDSWERIVFVFSSGFPLTSFLVFFTEEVGIIGVRGRFFLNSFSVAVKA